MKIYQYFGIAITDIERPLLADIDNLYRYSILLWILQMTIKTKRHHKYTRKVDSAFRAIWLVVQLGISLQYSTPEKNKMSFRFIPVTDEQTFVLNEAALSPRTRERR